MVKNARVEHRKSISSGCYEIYSEDVRFQSLKDFVNKNKKNIPEDILELLNDKGWVQSDRPDWINELLSAAIEDSTVEDTNHYLDKYFSSRRTKMQKNLIECGEIDGKTPIFVHHMPNIETLRDMNKQRNIQNWQKSVKMSLLKHKKMLEELNYSFKAIFLYDTTPPYGIRCAASVKGYIQFDPLMDKNFVKLFEGYPALIIWFMPTQKQLFVLDPDKLNIYDEGKKIDYNLIYPYMVFM